MSDVIVVQPVTQSLTVSPVSPVITISASGPQGATGAAGAKGDKGDTGATGSSGVVSVNSPIVNSGTSTAAILSLSYSSLVINGGTP